MQAWLKGSNARVNSFDLYCKDQMILLPNCKRAVVLLARVTLTGDFLHSHCSCQSKVCWITALQTPPPLFLSVAQNPMAQCQYLGRTLTCYHSHTPRTILFYKHTLKLKHQRTTMSYSYTMPYHFFTPFSDRCVILVSSNPDVPLADPDSLIQPVQQVGCWLGTWYLFSYIQISSSDPYLYNIHLH